MLTFFRRIRKSLLCSGQAQKYLIYAIGEILLVVIGILIALQINNWNEWRKDRVKEKVLLSQLHNEFIANKAELQRTVDLNKVQLEHTRKMIQFLPIDINAVDRDSLDSIFGNFHAGTATFNPSNAIIYSIASSNSIDLISDNILKQRILLWRGIFEDYHEDEMQAQQFGLETYYGYLLNHGASPENRLLDERVELNFLSSVQFESLLIRRRRTLLRICDPPADDSIFQELRTLEYIIDEIIELTASSMY